MQLIMDVEDDGVDDVMDEDINVDVDAINDGKRKKEREGKGMGDGNKTRRSKQHQTPKHSRSGKITVLHRCVVKDWCIVT